MSLPYPIFTVLFLVGLLLAALAEWASGGECSGPLCSARRPVAQGEAKGKVKAVLARPFGKLFKR